jgi:hypothetical protein
VDESFDPYRKWLGIPPEEQPPHHYRLLGLELFEADADVIVNAADARLSYFRSLAKDKHADMAERIAAQIKEVQLCLLDPAKKAFYDGQLQRRFAALKKDSSLAAAATDSSAILRGTTETASAAPRWEQPPAAVDPNPPQVAPSSEFAIPALKVPAYSQHSPHTPRKRWHLLAAMFLGLVATGCVLVFLLVKKQAAEEKTTASSLARSEPGIEKARGEKSIPIVPQGDPVKEKMAEKAKEKTPIPSGKGVKNPFTDIDPDTIRRPPPKGGHSSNPSGAGGSNPFEEANSKNPFEEPAPRSDPPTPPKKADRKTAAPKKPDLLEEDFSDDTDAPSPRKSAGKQLPVPPENARQAAEKTVRETYGLKIAATKNVAEKIALSDRIWAQATDSKNDPAARYAHLSVAFQLISESGRLQKAMNRADSFADYFEVDPWDLKGQAIFKTARAAQAALAARNNPLNIDSDEVVLISLQVADNALQENQFEVASKAVKTAAPLAKKDPILVREMNAFVREIDRQKTRYQPVRKASDALKEKPNDADANTLVGRWICFENHDWDKGLPKLAKAANAEIAKTAAKDLSAPLGAKEQLEIADAWWSLSQKEEGAAKAGMLARAAEWYDRALPNLEDPEKSRADAKLKSIAGSDTVVASGLGVVQPGNVASRQNHPSAFAIGLKANTLSISNAYTLFDGDTRNPGWDGEVANSKLPCVWIITLDKIYQLQQIRFHFFDGDFRYYHYAVDVSADGKNFKTLVEPTIGLTYKWQIIPVHGMPVQYVRLRGILSNKNVLFSVTEFEAYCIPPKQ